MTVPLDEMLKALVERQGSDLHLKAGRPPLFRISGLLVASEYPPVSNDDLRRLLEPILSPALRDKLEADGAVDLSYAPADTSRYRVNAFRQRGELSCVVRAVPLRVPTLDELYLPSVLADVAMSPSGLVLVTGPTGQGKSTTLAAMVEHINQRRPVHIVTVEDPIEFVYTDATASVCQREIGVDSPDFGTALKHILRQDPDVILIGEMRDAETIATAVTAAETGHLVLSTMHTIDAAQTVDRIIDTFSAGQQLQVRHQLAQVLRAVVCQRLVPMASRPGRVVAVEVMTNSPPVQKNIADGATDRLARIIEESHGGHYRMQTLNQSLAKHIKRELITLEAAGAASGSPEELNRLLRQMGLLD